MSTVTAFPGMRGSGDFTVTGQRPENWRQKILELDPNGDTVLTGILSMMGEEKTTDPHFHWFSRKLSGQSVSGTAGSFIYKNADLTTAYQASDDLAAGSTVYAKMSAANAKMFRTGHQVGLFDASDYTNTVNGEVLGVVINGASSYIAIELLEADGTGTDDLSTCDYVVIIGNINAEGASIPDAVAYDPTEYYNYTQIFETSLDATRTALQTNLRTGDHYTDLKRGSLLYHGVEMEKAFIWGIRKLGTGSNGKPKRTTMGLYQFIKDNTEAVKYDYRLETDAAFASKTWTQAGAKWVNTRLEEAFRFGAKEKLGICGSAALLGIQELIEAGTNYDISVSDRSYGIKVLNWVTPFGTLMLKTHPLFNYVPPFRNTIFILQPSNLKYRFVQDTIFKADPNKNWKQGGHLALDGLKESYLTECGLEFHHPETMGYLNGVGMDNAQ